MLMHRPQTPQPGFGSITLLQKFTSLPHFKILDPRLVAVVDWIMQCQESSRAACSARLRGDAERNTSTHVADTSAVTTHFESALLRLAVDLLSKDSPWILAARTTGSNDPVRHASSSLASWAERNRMRLPTGSRIRSPIHPGGKSRQRRGRHGDRVGHHLLYVVVRQRKRVYRLKTATHGTHVSRLAFPDGGVWGKNAPKSVKFVLIN